MIACPPTQSPSASLPAEGFVLAGGHSSRMGRDKALIHFGNASLISIAINTFQRVGLPARIAGSRSDLDAFAGVIPDTFVNVGPLGGVHAALATSKAEWSVFIPVDMPLLPASLLRCLLDRAAITRAAITCLRCNGFLHPFPVILHRSLLAPLTQELQSKAVTGCMKMWQKLAITSASGSNTLAQSIDTPAIESLLQAGQLIASTLPPTLWFQSANTPDEMRFLLNFIPPANSQEQIT